MYLLAVCALVPSLCAVYAPRMNQFIETAPCLGRLSVRGVMKFIVIFISHDKDMHKYIVLRLFHFDTNGVRCCNCLAIKWCAGRRIRSLQPFRTDLGARFIARIPLDQEARK